jgi:hypothetical protein
MILRKFLRNLKLELLIFPIEPETSTQILLFPLTNEILFWLSAISFSARFDIKQITTVCAKQFLTILKILPFPQMAK